MTSVYLTNLFSDFFKPSCNTSKMSWTLYRDIFEELQSGFKTLGLTLFNYNGPRVEWVKKS